MRSLRREEAVWTIGDLLCRVTDPVLRPVRNVMPNFGNVDLGPIVVVLLLTALAILLALLAYDAPVIETRIGAGAVETGVGAAALETPPFMYAGIRG